MIPEGFTDQGASTPDNLIAGEIPREAKEVTIASGETLVRGTVVGRVTASGHYVPCDPAAVDGSEAPQGVLVYDVDASAAATVGAIYRSGTFNIAALTFADGVTAADLEDALHQIGIHLKTNLGA